MLLGYSPRHPVKNRNVCINVFRKITLRQKEVKTPNLDIPRALKTPNQDLPRALKTPNLDLTAALKTHNLDLPRGLLMSH